MSENFSSQEQQASYGIGLQVAEQLANEPFPGFCPESCIAGIADSLGGKTLQVQPDQINQAFQAIQKIVQAEQASKQEALSKEGTKYLEENAKKDSVTTTESGLQYEVITEGSGEKPGLTSKVRTHYHGTLIDGTVFDSSYDRGQPAEFPVNGVIAGWTEALQMMPVGSKWKLTIPYNLAYGERGAGADIGPYATLVFDVELLEIL